MPTVNKPELKQTRWAPCVLEYVEVFRSFHATEPLPEQRLADILRKRMSEDTPVLATGMVPYLRTGSFPIPRLIGIWIRIQVDGYEYVCTCVIRNAAPLTQPNCLVEFTGENDIKTIRLKRGTEFQHHAESDVFLSVRPEDGPRVLSPMSGVDANFIPPSGGRESV